MRRSALHHALVKTRHVASEVSRATRDRLRPPDDRVSLDTLQRRLEIVLAAIYDRAIPVAAIPDSRPKGTVRRAIANVRALASPPPPDVATSDGGAVLLPPHMPHGMSPADAITRYRLLAIEQAERIVRGTSDHMPEGDAVARDLYLLREARAVDRAIMRANAGLAPAIVQARSDALAGRPDDAGMTPIEQAVERLTRDALGDVDVPGADDDSESPDASARWAVAKAASLRALRGEYRGVPPVALWGAPRAPRAAAAIDPAKIDPANIKAANANAANAVPLPIGDVSSASDAPHENDANVGVSDAPSDDALDIDLDLLPLLPPSTDPTGTQETHVQSAGDPDDPIPQTPGISYPEWDATAGRYLPNGVTVRVADAEEGDERWANDTLAGRASLLRRVQQQFERLRARRLRLNAQRRGDDIDLAACVRAIVDRRAGLSPDERHYTDTRPARRGLAISLLVDVSGSTDTQVTHALQVIDIEKIALLLATTAFDALGDPYNVMTFTGRGAADVRMATVKSFSERSGLTVRRRIAALRPEGGTRLGAAVRHAVALLQRQPAGHRLLLILSDGRPNDVGYMDSYGVEDSRQAILEARAAGIFPFCLTVDRDGADYLPHLFGSAGHVVIRNPEQLPAALLRAVRQLLRFS